MQDGSGGTIRNGAGPTVEAVLPPGNDNLIGRVIDGRYRIVSLIAAGGMGRVYVAEQLSLARKVAIKVLALSQLHIRSDARFLQRFTQEATTASRVNCPNAVTIFDFGHTQDDLYYLVMELVEGKTLAQVLRHERSFEPARAVRIAIQISYALREAHRHGIIHRDIKPGNLVLCAPSYEMVKVLDFGIAKLVERDSSEAIATLTASGTFVGTPEYCAPEALMGKADQRSDLYSLGIVMYLMLQGRLPFKGESPAETISMVLNDPVPMMTPSHEVSPALEAIVMRLLENQPQMRFQTVDQLLQALEVVERQLAPDTRTHSLAESMVGEPELDLSPATGQYGEEAPAALQRGSWPVWLSTRGQRLAFIGSVGAVWVVGGALLLWLGSQPTDSDHTLGKEPAQTISPDVPTRVHLVNPDGALQGNEEAVGPTNVLGSDTTAAPSVEAHPSPTPPHSAAPAPETTSSQMPRIETSKRPSIPAVVPNQRAVQSDQSKTSAAPDKAITALEPASKHESASQPPENPVKSERPSEQESGYKPSPY